MPRAPNLNINDVFGNSTYWAICSECSDRRHSSCIPEQANQTDDSYLATDHRRKASSKKTTPDVSAKEHIPNHWNNLKILDETELRTKTRLWKLLIHQLRHLIILIYVASINKRDTWICENTLQVCVPRRKKRHPQILTQPALWRPSLGQHKNRLQVPVFEWPFIIFAARAFAFFTRGTSNGVPPASPRPASQQLCLTSQPPLQQVPNHKSSFTGSENPACCLFARNSLFSPIIFY